MHSKLSIGFFKIGKTIAPSGQRYLSLGALNFVPNTFDEKRIQELKDSILKTERSIVKTEHELINLHDERHSYQEELKELSKPFQRYQQIIKAIDEMSIMITKGIYTSLINGSLTMADGPSWGYDANLLGIFKQILSKYHMTLYISSQTGQGEISDYLHIKFPSIFCKTTVSLAEGNTKYNELLNSFDKRLELAYKNAEAKIDEDFAILKRNLLDPVEDGRLNAISKSQPCPAAYERFKKMADENNISISRQGSVIFVEKNSIEENAGLGPRC